MTGTRFREYAYNIESRCSGQETALDREIFAARACHCQALVSGRCSIRSVYCGFIDVLLFEEVPARRVQRFGVCLVDDRQTAGVEQLLAAVWITS